MENISRRKFMFLTVASAGMVVLAKYIPEKAEAKKVVGRLQYRIKATPDYREIKGA